MIGKQIDRYHILDQLGEGGMATVYKAFDARLEREVAVKVIHPIRQHTPKFLKRFEREAKSLAKLSHPNIVKVLDYGEHDGLPYIVMEYFPGGTLKDKLGKPMPWQKAAKLLAPIAQALEYAHQCNIIHRDVKPANILISDSGQAMLSDFGIAKVLELEETVDLTGTGVGIGTPEYMAPEQGLGKTVDHRADIYSLGVVFYELITGRKPFKADTPMAVVVKKIHDPLPRPKTIIRGLPISVERVLFKALIKKPEDRFQSMAELAHTLERLGRGEKPGRGKLQTGSKRRKWLLLGVGATVLFVMLLFLGQYVYEIPTIFYHNQPESTLESFNEPTKKLTPSVGAGFQATQDVAIIDQTATPTGLNMMGTINAVRTQLSATASAETKTEEPTFTPIVEGLPPVARIVNEESFDNIPVEYSIESFDNMPIESEKESFDNTSFEFELEGNYSLSNGIISLEDPITSGDIWADGSSKLKTSFLVKQGNGYLLLFRSKPNAQYLITMEYGPYDNSNYRAFWFENGGSISIWTGSNLTYNRSLVFQLKHDVWYYFILRRYTEGFEGFIWEKNRPDKLETFNAFTGSDWAANNLDFTVNIPAGVIEIEEFQELVFFEDPSISFTK